MHGDLTGAFRTGFYGALTQLRFASNDLLVGGTWGSQLVVWSISEAARKAIPKRDPNRSNAFDPPSSLAEDAKQPIRRTEEEKQKQIQESAQESVQEPVQEAKQKQNEVSAANTSDPVEDIEND